MSALTAFDFAPQRSEEGPMSLFGKTVRECAALVRFLRPAFLMLAVLGVFRVFIGAIGVPQSIGTWISSGTLLAVMLAVCYGYPAPSHGFNRFWQFILSVCLYRWSRA